MYIHFAPSYLDFLMVAILEHNLDRHSTQIGNMTSTIIITDIRLDKTMMMISSGVLQEELHQVIGCGRMQRLNQEGENSIFWSLQTHGLYLSECRHGLGQGNSDGVVTIREEGVRSSRNQCLPKHNQGYLLLEVPFFLLCSVRGVASTDTQ